MNRSTSLALTRFRAAQAELLAAAAEVDACVERATGAPLAMPPLVRRIRGLVCAHYELPVTCLNSRSRESYHAEARHVAIALCHAFSPMAMQALGELFLRDYGTVVHAIRRVRDQQKTDQNFRATFEKLFQRVRATLPPRPAHSTDD